MHRLLLRYFASGFYTWKEEWHARISINCDSSTPNAAHNHEELQRRHI
jgi:hypothetical protein